MTTSPSDVARDALALLEAGVLLAAPGTYVESETLLHPGMDRPISDSLTQSGCKVCALGALFVAWVTKDKTPRRELDWSVIVNRGFGWAGVSSVLKMFPTSMLTTIENAFERDLVERYPNPDNRLRYILQNIIDNDGVYVP